MYCFAIQIYNGNLVAVRVVEIDNERDSITELFYLRFEPIEPHGGFFVAVRDDIGKCIPVFFCKQLNARENFLGNVSHCELLLLPTR